ncbi:MULTISPECIES: divalent metal cation transporter [unclassified Rhizobium]|jgi:Mn2+/Fe2+ NRAMP family transporter|uniref:NRAMP family divalent metal transporter n=1 Tax=unclassified Rhizobium TaxID=2613769 RepID=UPI00068CB278|nr:MULTISPECIES: divalent metal cation transporter [unclassified Rhizobium]OJY79611.1 MAG: iron transporter [Rhizobium sp. 60-20]RKD35540.1 Mn2+/Fe2+ NRAMP family transporter [Rhizobium sp. WW_1]
MSQELLADRPKPWHSRLSSRLARLRQHPLAKVGPGLITGVADDDPSGIATYSQAGAQFGLNMLWTMPVSFPMMAVVQATCARIGRVTGRGLAANIKDAFPPVVLYAVVFSLLTANILNIAADVAAMGEVAELVTGFNRHLMTMLFVFGTLALQVFIPYHRYVSFLKWLTISLLAYAAVLFTVHVDWKQVAIRTVWPIVAPTSAYAAVVVGVFGTTISPYLFFWQASEEVEDMNADPGAMPLSRDSETAPRELRRIGWDTWSGMLYSNLTAFFIILATAVTLNVAGITQIDTAAEAASALRPLAGPFAALIFALGILGVGLIGVPVLAGSAGYALAEAMGWKFGLERAPNDAQGFYGVIAISVLLALIIQYSPITPMNALFWSAVINGVLAVPLIAVILLLAASPKVMGPYTIGAMSSFIGWATVALMGVAAVMMFVPT